MIALTNMLMTAEELLALPDDDLRYELVKGEVRCMSPAGSKHGRLALELGRLVANFVHERGLGQTYAAETGFVLARDPDTVRAPDVAFVQTERIPPDGPSDSFWEGAPDLAVEVLSPSDSMTEVEDKVFEYLAAGCRLVWVVNPRAERVTAYRSAHDIRSFAGDDLLDGADVLPGFSVPVHQIFHF